MQTMPMDSWIYQIFLHIVDAKGYRGCSMNNGVKSSFLGLQNLVESSRSGNIGNVNEINTFFPCLVEGKDGFSLGK
jgi:hypothetical protein